MLADKLGICQWFHYEDGVAASKAIQHLADLGVKHLRTDISWADASRPNGWQWYRHLYRELHAAGIDILPCVYLTPPSISENHNTNGPPHRLEDYAAFVWRSIKEVGQWVGPYWELWNEPNNSVKWDEEFDPFSTGRKKQGTMLGRAAEVVHEEGFKPLLGGMSPIDHTWINLMTEAGALEYCEVIAVHAFPDMWNDRGWQGWDGVVDYFNRSFPDKPIWVTEVGRSTSPPAGSLKAQAACLEEIFQAMQKHDLLQRVYWYSLFDLPQSKEELEFTTKQYREPAEHSLGLITETGVCKPTYKRFQELMRL